MVSVQRNARKGFVYNFCTSDARKCAGESTQERQGIETDKQCLFSCVACLALDENEFCI